MNVPSGPVSSASTAPAHAPTGCRSPRPRTTSPRERDAEESELGFVPGHHVGHPYRRRHRVPTHRHRGDARRNEHAPPHIPHQHEPRREAPEPDRCCERHDGKDAETGAVASSPESRPSAPCTRGRRRSHAGPRVYSPACHPGAGATPGVDAVQRRGERAREEERERETQDARRPADVVGGREGLLGDGQRVAPNSEPVVNVVKIEARIAPARTRRPRSPAERTRRRPSLRAPRSDRRTRSRACAPRRATLVSPLQAVHARPRQLSADRIRPVGDWTCLRQSFQMNRPGDSGTGSGAPAAPARLLGREGQIPLTRWPTVITGCPRRRCPWQ